MFPRPEHPSTPAHGWLATLRHGLDLIVAFATLRDVDTSPEAGWRDADDPSDRASRTRPVAAVPPATAAAKRLTGHPDRGATAAARTAPAGREVGAAAMPAAHPHRRPLSTPSRGRRPGAVRPAPQPCLTPLVARRGRPTPAPARGARH